MPGQGQVVEHHRAREDGRHRVGHPLPRQVGGGAVAGLENGVVITQVGRGSHSHPPHQSRRQVGEDVAQQVLGDDHVEPLGPADQLERGGVDVKVLGRDIGVTGRDLVKHLAEERERPEDIRLVHARDLSVPAWPAGGPARTRRGPPARFPGG